MQREKDNCADKAFFLELPCADANNPNALASYVDRMVPASRMPDVSFKGLELFGDIRQSKKTRSMNNYIELILSFLARLVLDPAQDPFSTGLVPLHAHDPGLEANLVIDVEGFGCRTEIGQHLGLLDKLFGEAMVGCERVTVEMRRGVGLAAGVGV